MIPLALAVVLMAGALTWIAFCYREWTGYTEKANARLNERDERQASRQAEVLREVFEFSTPDLVDLLFANQLPGEAPLTVDQLRAAASKMSKAPGAADETFALHVTEPVVRRSLERLTKAPDRIWTALVLQPRVVAGLMSMRCYSSDSEGARRRIKGIADRYGLQAIILVAWIGLVIVGYGAFQQATGVPILLGLVPVAHGIHLEWRRRQLDMSLT